ncbi:hypothetical protein SAMN05421788_106184 [Filimonas lacunae]|uniref:Aspartyl protease n=1 Tax=Filimonas lacunae TaxID=477680 RepID=A0A173MEV4_9BACT|nr:hypothetical protein [Filimonas lacunae]BAV06124.1 hypothetical protein FLA_2139 [Filimonas lacunae]SIT24762.1 hypothetical protein SAMN05421788_106184 [Filimonas lacunae]
MNIRFHILLSAGLLLLFASCKKTEVNSSATTSSNSAVKLGLYEADSSIYKLLFIPVPKIGTQTVNEYLIFDTGSGGMVIDAHEVLPASMITSSGFNFTGDSTVVNGITITNQTSSITYGADNSTTEKVYGNLAYANVTVGDHGNTVTIQRLPFFLYYKGVDNAGNMLSTGSFDIFGVNTEYDVTFSNGGYVASPFSTYTPAAGLTKGFKMEALGTSNFSLAGTYVPDVITLGLSATDLNESGFTQHTLTPVSGYGYSVIIPSSYTYGSKTVNTAYAVFDTGTEPYSYMEDNTASTTPTLLPVNTAVSVTTKSAGFNYNYSITSSDYLTYIENPIASGSDISIISLEYFLKNGYMLDYENHRLGLRNY